MIRLPALGAAAAVLALFALPTFATPHAKDPGAIDHRDTRGEIQDVDLADVVTTAQAQGADGADGLPTTWCGDETAADDTVDAVTPASKAQFKLVYAFAADRPDRFATWKDALQANVAVIQRFLSAEDGGTKALRFDMGTRCGPQFVDIQVVPLPGPHSAYADNFSAISSAVHNALGATANVRDTIVMADGMSGSTQEYGLGETVMGSRGEQQGAANIHNRGGLTSMLFSRDGAAAPGAAKWGWWPEGMLHEMTHNMGAVQWGAPHSTEPAGQTSPQYGHCWQGADVMCYVEDAGASHAMEQDCAPLPGAIPQSYDCNRDDYFSPAPAAGSYLATHWNTYDSAFLAPCGEIAPACGGGTLWVPTPPAATGAPTIGGTARRGSTLTALPGSWQNGASSFAYQWQRFSDNTWDDIDGATAARYVAHTEDIGLRLRVQVLATNDDGTANAASAPTNPIGAAGLFTATSSSHKAKGKKATASSRAKAKASAKAKAKASAKRKAKAKASAKRKAKAKAAAKHRAQALRDVQTKADAKP
jgi:hypothetical protein